MSAPRGTLAPARAVNVHMKRIGSCRVLYRSFGPKGTSHTGTLRENQVVLLCIYSVNDPAHMVRTLGNTHIICALRSKITVG